LKAAIQWIENFLLGLVIAIGHGEGMIVENGHIAAAGLRGWLNK